MWMESLMLQFATFANTFAQTSSGRGRDRAHDLIARPSLHRVPHSRHAGLVRGGGVDPPALALPDLVVGEAGNADVPCAFCRLT